MSGMEPLRTYDYLAQSRSRVLAWARPLGEAGYTQRFPIGLGTLGRTLTHIMTSEWYYVERIERREVPPYESWPIRDEEPPPLADLEAAWAAQAVRTRRALGAVKDWDAPIEYEVAVDDGRRQVVMATAGGLFTQLALHEVHHQAQAMNMLRRLGVTIEDIDFNTTMFARRDAGT